MNIALIIIHQAMNFLAHIVLSGERPLHLVGNYTGDFIKGRTMEAYPLQMQLGARAHRAIDSFTDAHVLVRQCSDVFRPVAGRYSGIITDVVFDHFLSQHWYLASAMPREKFIARAEYILWNHRFLMPPHARKLLPSLIYKQYLSAYVSFYGLHRVLQRMALRTSLPDVSREAIVLLGDNYRELEQNFLTFWNELAEYSKGLE